MSGVLMPVDPREAISLLGEVAAELVVTCERLENMAASDVTGVSVTPPPPMSPYQVTGPATLAATIADLTAKKAALKAQADGMADAIKQELAAL